MRALGTLAVVGLGIGVIATSAVAGPDPKKPGAKGATIDVSSFKDLIALSDDDGNLYVVRPRVMGRDAGPVFVGDGTTFYLQRLVGGGMDGSKGTWSYSMWAPRVPGYDDAILRLDDSKRYFLSCRRAGVSETELRLLGKKETAALLAKAVFKPRLFDRRVHLLARDEDGTYYFVDRDFDAAESDHGASKYERRFQHGHRVFVGKKGAMKVMPMTNVVADTAGEIYTTKRGELRIITDESAKTATWVRGRKRTPLKLLDLNDNRYLIYRELGVYTFIGTVCEDL